MNKNDNKKVSRVALKVSAVLGAALASLTGTKSEALNTMFEGDASANKEQVQDYKIKPMPVLKLNMENPADSKFVANHQSHGSHRSHSSHYSHRSGGPR